MCSVTVFGCFSLSPATSAIGCGFVKYKGADSSFYQLRAVEYNLYSANYLYILYTLYTLYSLLFPPSWTIVTLYDSSPTVNDGFTLHLLFGYDSLSTVYAESLTSAHISVHSINTTHGYSLLFPPSWTIVTLYDSSPTDQRYRLHFCVRLHHLLLRIF